MLVTMDMFGESGGGSGATGTFTVAANQQNTQVQIDTRLSSVTSIFIYGALDSGANDYNICCSEVSTGKYCATSVAPTYGATIYTNQGAFGNATTNDYAGSIDSISGGTVMFRTPPRASVRAAGSYTWYAQ